MSSQSPSQTVGPFFHDALIDGRSFTMVHPGTQGTQILIHGTVFDGDGEPIDDAMVEIWQADANGVYNHPQDPNWKQADPAFTGFGRSDTKNSGHYRFETVKPGVAAGQVTPFVSVRVFSRGMLIHAVTRLYFEDEGATNEQDPLLSTVPADRRPTLLATRSGHDRYHFDIYLQGPNETVFFDL